MKPIGRFKVNFPSKHDHGKRVINWWESEMQPNKTKGKRVAMKYETDLYERGNYYE